MMIIGEKVYLRLMEEHDIPLKVQWINDEEIRNLLIIDYISEAGTKVWFLSAIKSNTRKEFMICCKDNDEVIGFTSLKNIEYNNRKAELSMLIGNKDYWGKGVAKEARTLLITYAFNELGLNRLYTYNWSENERIIGLNKKLGFQVDGILRQNIFFKGSFRDIYIMGLLKSDWEKDFA